VEIREESQLASVGEVDMEMSEIGFETLTGKMS